jgi:hypothetical protein
LQQHLGDVMSTKTPFTAIRNGAAAVTLVAVAVLGLVAAESGGTVVRHTVVTKHETRVVNHTTAPKSSTPTQSAPVASSVPDTAPVSEAAAPATPVAPDPVTLASSTPATTPATTTTTPTTTTGSSLPTTTANDIPACPAGLAAPAQSGGLQSLIGFAPLFGPFSSEAFAMAPSFQPVLELIGPFLTAFANYYAPEAPTLAPLLNAVDSLETEGYSLLAPLFGPYQTQFLTAETKLAAALAPDASLLVDNPAASCVIDIEASLTSAGH